MDDIINNICFAEYSPLDTITDFITSPTGTAEVTAAWYSMNMATGARLSIREVLSKAGRSYETDFSVTLRRKIHVTEPVIIRFTLSNGNKLLIGDKDLPVRLLEDHSLTSKTLTFSHVSWHYPFKLI